MIVWLLCCCSVAQSCPTLCDPMDYSMSGFPVHPHLPELAKLMFIETVMPSNHLVFHRPLLLLPSILPSIRVFSNHSALHIRWPKYWSFSFSIVLPMNIQDWFPLGWTGLISLQSKGLSRFFSNTTVQNHQFYSTQLSLWSTLTSIHDYWKDHSFDYGPLSAKWCLHFLICCLGFLQLFFQEASVFHFF